MSSERFTNRPSPVDASIQVAISQERAQPLSRVRLAPGMIRYMYDRSSESKANGEPGQDYLTSRYTGGCCVSCVCEGFGVFFGGVRGALFGGALLVRWLGKHPSLGKKKHLKRDFFLFLPALVGPPTPLIEIFPPPAG